MKNSELAYWLQGFFEISEAGKNPITELLPSQLQIIRNHLNLAKKVETNFDDFGNWLEGTLDLWDAQNASLSMSPVVVKTIRDRLNRHFQHVLDARFPNRDKLQAIHDGHPNIERPSQKVLINFLVNLGSDNLRELARLIETSSTSEEAHSQISSILRDFNRSANYQ